MSLSFVTKAIQTTAADGTFEEQAVENDDNNKQGSRGGNTIGLFDQLRQNKDEEEAARLEFQRSIMRGTLALDEDDAAHLQELQRQKEAENDAQLRQTELQLASFRAAQADRFERSTTLNKHQPLSTLEPTVITGNSIDRAKSLIIPNIKIKKRRRDECHSYVAERPGELDVKRIASVIETETAAIRNENHPASAPIVQSIGKNNDGGTMLSSLLLGYSSNEDD